MAKKITVSYTDDMGGSGVAQPVRFAIENEVYEIDLNQQHQESLRKKLAPFIKNARPVSTKSLRSAVSQETVRKWAKDNNIPVADRGRIAESVLAQYLAAITKE